MITFVSGIVPNPQLCIRLTSGQLAAIDVLVDSGDFGNRSEFVQYAVRKILMNYEGRGAPSVKSEP